MISDITIEQLATLSFTGRPLVICDVDEVIVHFTRDFETYIGRHGLWLETSSFALNGNIKKRENGAAADISLVNQLIDDFSQNAPATWNRSTAPSKR